MFKAIEHDTNEEYKWFVWDGVESHLPKDFEEEYELNGLKLILDHKVVFVGAVVIYKKGSHTNVYKNIIQAKAFYSFPDFKSKTDN